jgi:hypothetical protein
VYILRAGVLIEGIGMSYDPNFNSLSTSIPIYKGIVDRALGTKGWPTIKDTVVKEATALYTLLKDMESVFARASRDQLRVRIHAADVDGLEKFLSHLFRRVVMTISGIGLAIVSSIIYLRVNSLLLLLFGLAFSFWLVALVFLLPNPQRYPFRVRRARRAGRML